MVDFFIRGENIFDLYLINCLILVSKVVFLFGIGDYDIVYIEVNIKLQVSKIKFRNVYLYKKVDWDGFRYYIVQYKDYVFMNEFLYINFENLWNEFK